MAGDGDVEAGAVLELVGPERFKAGGEQVAGGGEEVEVEEGVAVGGGRGEFVGKGAVGEDLGAEGDGFEVVAEICEGGVVRGEAGVGGGLEQPGAADVVFAVACETGEAGGGEPLAEGGKPGFEGEQILRREDCGGEGFGVGEEGNGLGDLGEGGGVDDAVGVASCAGSDCGVDERRFHAGRGSDEPGVEVGGGVLGIKG